MKKEYTDQAAEMIAVLKKEAEAQKKSNNSIAIQVGVAPSTIGRIFKGDFIPKADILLGINDALGNPLDV